MNYIRVIIILTVLAILVLADDQDLQKIFERTKVKGTLIISSSSGDEEYVSDCLRANKRYIPASTFKIPNTLIALEERAIKDESEVIRWDGEVRPYAAWNRDHDLSSAMAVSCVWCYQKFAQEIGDDRYLTYLKKMHYGNEKRGPDVTTFWLDGDLRISAAEQIVFLKKLYKDALPFKQAYMDITKKILTVEETTEHTIKAKTGWSGSIGWYVGYIETKKKVWFFALNADITKDELALRKEIVMEALRVKNII